MSTNPYPEPSYNQRWEQEDPTAEDLMNIARIAMDHLHWILDQVFIQHKNTATADVTLATGKNAVSAGPITVNSGVTITIQSGATWRIV